MLILFLAIGLVLLLIGGELFVRGSVSIARRLGVSPLLIGLTLVGFGTSTPELVTSLQAAMAGSPGVATGNVIGSNIANILLILGLAALLKPVLVDARAFRRDSVVLVLSALLCLGVVMSGVLDRLSGLAFITGLVVYIGFAIWQERGTVMAGSVDIAAAAGAGEPLPAPSSTVLAGMFTLSGLALVIIGASLLIDGAVGIATRFGISETIIGLSIVAVGTSLPELATSVIAALRGQGDVAFGNIVGSNIYNVLGILGVTALVQPIPVPPEIMAADIWIMLAATCVLILVARTGHRITRTEGTLMLASYGAYTAWLASQV